MGGIRQVEMESSSRLTFAWKEPRQSSLFYVPPDGLVVTL